MPAAFVQAAVSSRPQWCRVCLTQLRQSQQSNIDLALCGSLGHEGVRMAASLENEAAACGAAHICSLEGQAVQQPAQQPVGD